MFAADHTRGVSPGAVPRDQVSHLPPLQSARLLECVAARSGTRIWMNELLSSRVLLTYRKPDRVDEAKRKSQTALHGAYKKAVECPVRKRSPIRISKLGIRILW